MTTYIQLVKWTAQGIETLRDVPTRERVASQRASSLAGSHTTWFTLGEWDAVNIIEAPDDETAAARALEIAGHGNIRTATMRAFSLDEFKAILARIPPDA